MILQDHLASVLDGGAYRSDLDEHLGTVAVVLDHALDLFQMADGAGQTVDDIFLALVDVRVGVGMGFGMGMRVRRHAEFVWFMHGGIPRCRD